MILVGALILVIGLAQIVRVKARKEGLVTAGLYRFVRHPQHLGIAILFFGLLILNRDGIRIGDIMPGHWLSSCMFCLQTTKKQRLRGNLENPT